jgi:hypothetical protein
MQSNSRKPKEWVGITNEPNCKFTTTHVHVVLFKGPACLPYPTLFGPTLPLAHILSKIG